MLRLTEPEATEHSISAYRFDEPNELLEVLPSLSYRLTPTGCGAFEAAVTSIRLGDLALQVGSSSPSIGFVALAPGRALIHLPLAGTEALTLNGVSWRVGMVATGGPGCEVSRASTRVCSYATLTLPAELIRDALDTPLHDAAFAPGHYLPRQVDPAIWQKVATMILAVAETASRSPLAFEAEQARLALRDGLLRAMRDILAKDEVRMPVPRSAATRRRIVAKVDEYLRDNLSRPIYTEELCRELAVSPAALADAFRAIFQTSPHRFLKLRRLSMVRAALRDHRQGMPLIKSVAISHGFWHLGQLARDYRAAFGESPSDTLARRGA